MSVIRQSEPIDLPPTHRWTYQKVKACLRRGPFMLGAPAFACETHHVSDRSVPCFRELQGCNLACPYCPQRCQWTAYVPLIDCADAKLPRVVFTGGKKTWEDVRALAVGTLVHITRGPGQTDTLRVGLWPSDHPTGLAPLARPKCLDDITPYLLHLWQLRELTEHYGQRFFRARGRREDAPPTGRKVPKPLGGPAGDIARKLADDMKP